MRHITHIENVPGSIVEKLTYKGAYFGVIEGAFDKTNPIQDGVVRPARSSGT